MRFQVRYVKLPQQAFWFLGTLLASTLQGSTQRSMANEAGALPHGKSRWILIDNDGSGYAPKPPSPPPQNETPQRNEGRSREEIRRRMQERQQRLEVQMRQAMSNLGFTDIPMQDAIISYIGTDIRARRPLQIQGRRLFSALRSKDLSEAELSKMVTDFRAAVEADRQRRAASEAALDARIKYTQNPRLEAMLLLFGVIGDSPLLSVLRQASANPAPATNDASNAASRNNTIPRNKDQGAQDPAAARPDQTVKEVQPTAGPAAENETANDTESKADNERAKRRKNREGQNSEEGAVEESASAETAK